MPGLPDAGVRLRGGRLMAAVASTVAIKLSPRQLADLELFRVGGYRPLTGFMTEPEYAAVLKDMHLPDGQPWPLPITLAVDAETAALVREGDRLDLLDGAGRRRGELEVRQRFHYDKTAEAQAVYRTTDSKHPGVAALYAQGEVLLGRAGDVFGPDAGPGRRPSGISRQSSCANGLRRWAGARWWGSRRAIRFTERMSTSRRPRWRWWMGCWCIRWWASPRKTMYPPTCAGAATRCSWTGTFRATGWCWRRCRRRCATRGRVRPCFTRWSGAITAARISSWVVTTRVWAITTARTTRSTSLSEFDAGELGITPLFFEHAFLVHRLRRDGLGQDLSARHGEPRVPERHTAARAAERRPAAAGRVHAPGGRRRAGGCLCPALSAGNVRSGADAGGANRGAAVRVRIATRRSPLARAQAALVADLLTSANPGLRVEFVLVETTGDRDRSRAIEALGERGVFSRGVQAAQVDGRADVAVHSYKDLPTAPLAGLRIAAVPVRADPRDALVSHSGVGMADLPDGATVGTGSARRSAQVRAVRPDLHVQPLRGNVGTRVERVQAGELEAAVLALAGLERAGLDTAIAEVLEPPAFLPGPRSGRAGGGGANEPAGRGTVG